MRRRGSAKGSNKERRLPGLVASLIRLAGVGCSEAAAGIRGASGEVSAAQASGGATVCLTSFRAPSTLVKNRAGAGYASANTLLTKVVLAADFFCFILSRENVDGGERLPYPHTSCKEGL